MTPAAEVQRLFELGNYAAVALAANRECWQTYASYGCIGKTKQALEGLQRFEDPQARFYEGVALWIGGRKQRARKVLAGVDSEHARNLLRLIDKPTIEVLAFLPRTGKAPHDLMAVHAADKQFRVVNVGLDPVDPKLAGAQQPPDRAYGPYRSIRDCWDREAEPDFLVTEMLEWHLIPTDIRQLNCPLLAHTADFDLHIQAVHPWLQAFDEILVTDPTEWRDVQPLVNVPVTTFPKTFGLAEKMAPIPRGPREIDLFQSGSVTHPYHPDKARLLHELIGNDQLEIYFLDGFASPEDYFALIASSKTAFTYIRHPGAMPTRGLEALAMGSAVAVQEGSVLTLFAGEEEGVFTYGPGEGDLARCLEGIVEHWDSVEGAAYQGAKKIRREFGMRRVAGEYFRYLAFVASRPRPARRERNAQQLEQKRAIIWKGWLPSGAEHEHLKQLRKLNFARFQEKVRQSRAPQPFIEITREMLLEYVSVVRGAGYIAVNQSYLEKIFTLMRMAIAAHPDNLVLHFNFIRAALHYGNVAEQHQTLALAEKVLERPAEEWSLDPMDDVLPWDFFSTTFNYRAYFDSVVEILSQRPPAADLRSLILASLHYYLGRMKNDRRLLERAVELDGEFPFYRWELARHLEGSNQEADCSRAVELLESLASDSILLAEAWGLLKDLHEQGRATSKSLARIESKVARLPRNYHGGFWAEDARAVLSPTTLRIPRKGWTRADWKPYEEGTVPAEVEIFRPAEMSANRPIRVSAIVSTYKSERFIEGLIEDLEAQTIADQIEIVVVDSGSPEDERSIIERFQQRYDNIVYVRTAERESSHAAISRAINLARGEYVTLANTDDRHRRDFCERMACVLDERPDVALVYADIFVTIGENETFENFTRAGHVSGIDYQEITLLDRCHMGPQPMWRRSVHETYGTLDASIESAGDWEFWLRISETETMLHVDQTLGLYYYSPTSSERRDPERKQSEISHIQELYKWRRERCLGWQQEALFPAVAVEEPLVLVYRTDADPGSVNRCLKALRDNPSNTRDLRVRLCKLDPGLADNSLEVSTSPSLPLLGQLLLESETWRHHNVLIIPDLFAASAGWIDELLERSVGVEIPRILSFGEDSQFPALMIPGVVVHRYGGLRGDAEPLDALAELRVKTGEIAVDFSPALPG